jgi:hypothetical protein
MQASNRVPTFLQETSCEKSYADETPEQQAQHREIARKYRRKPTRGRRRPAIVAFRIRDLETVFADRYRGGTMPDDDYIALDHLIVLLHHVARLGDPRAMRACAARWCPWMSDVEYAAVVAEIDAEPPRWTADRLARRIMLDDATRTRLAITTIGATDVNKAQRANRRRKQNITAKRLKRAKAGVTPRASSAARLKPWLALGISERTYYRRLANGSVGSNTGTAAFLSTLKPNYCQTGGPPRKRGAEARADVDGKKNCTAPVDRIRVVNISDAEPLNLVPRDVFCARGRRTWKATIDG